MSSTTLPTGTVSFLFSDIEGSTRLLTSLGREDFVVAIEAHNEIFRRVVGAAEVSTEGDAFFCAFAGAEEALRAAVAIQRLLSEYVGPHASKILVRMGIHTGEGRFGGDNYVGLDVHRAARIASSAHGGQVLLSNSTMTLVENSLPPGTSLVDLGEHHLKDLARPEHLFQVDVEGLRSDFPAVNSLETAEIRLPVMSTSFIGRAEELREALEMIAEARLVTLAGMGGSGKTRLAVEVGREVGDSTGRSVYFVGLADATDGGMIAAATARALSLPEQAGRSIEATLVDWLTDRSDVLILDNCEQVADDAAGLVEKLLHGCPNLTILTTSREALRVAGERLMRVGSLELPDSPLDDRVWASDAVELFVSRARQADPGFEPEPWREEVVAICRRLEGIPLALELAAARAPVLNPREILDRLEDRFSLLKSRSRSGEARHSTLEAAMDWSYELLDDPSRRLLNRLSVFRGGFSLSAVGAVCVASGDKHEDLLDRLGDLSDKSLVVKEMGFTETRFRLLETIREYAANRLDRSGDLDAATARHREYFTSFVRDQTAQLAGADQIAALGFLEADHENLRTMMRRMMEVDDVDAAADIAGRLSWFWYLHAHFTEGQRWSDELLQHLPSTPNRAWLRLLIGTAQYDYRVGQLERAVEKLRSAVDFAVRSEESRLEMWAHAYLATAEAYHMDMDTARLEAGRALDLAVSEGDLLGMGYATYMQINAESGSLLIRDELTSDEAIELLTRLAPVVQTVTSLGDRNMIGHVFQSEGILAAHADDTRRAVSALDSAIAALTEIGTVGCACHCIEAIAEYVSARGIDRQAARLLGASEGLRNRIGITITPIEDHFQRMTLQRLQAALPGPVLEKERSAGRTLSLPEASQLARQILADG